MNSPCVVCGDEVDVDKGEWVDMFCQRCWKKLHSDRHSILCVKHIVTTMADASETDAWLHRPVDMPAPPAPGSYVTDGAWECHVVELAWFTNLQRYVVFAEPDTELRDAHMNQKYHHRSVEEIVNDWVEGGWEFLGRGATFMDALLAAAQEKDEQVRSDD